ncbi:MAG: TatD family hydrolase [Firmicutes bacterium]|nr:TatD family hydrolase [Bacillota bacterium]
MCSACLVDTHAHLGDPKFAGDLDQMVSRAEASGVRAIIAVGCDLDSSRLSLALAERFPGVYAALGVHPHEAGQAPLTWFREIRTMAANPRVVALGEMGLDYFYDFSPRPVQDEVFRLQLRMARDLGLPVLVHSRESHEDVVSILEREKAQEIGGIMHCFSGDRALAQRCVEAGMLLGCGGTLTFAKAGTLRDVLRSLPCESLVLETDCPYLAPEPKRGRRNEPAFVAYVAAKLAEIRSQKVEEVATATSSNVLRLMDRLRIQKGP